MTGRATPKLELQGLAKTFRCEEAEVPALREVTLAVEAGELVSIIGPSGCGKSTLFNIVAGVTPPSRGSVKIDGRHPDELLGAVGYMPQRDCLMPWRSVLENAALGLELAGVGRKEARRLARAEFDRFGLSGFEDRWPAELSGGMVQRTALLRTFLAGREIMLLDEPFGALDALTRSRMQRWLLEVWQRDRQTVLLVTHDVDEALFLSDRVYVMSARPGRIVLSVEVDLDRPRSPETTLTPEFTALKRKLLDALGEETPWEPGPAGNQPYAGEDRS